MFYTIYKIINLIDGKIYIGKHQTKDLNDGYMGSGKQLKRAQAKHGIENFKKEILFQFDNEADMNAKEAELVTEEFCLKEDTYNLCPGGKGGWGYVNANDELRVAKNIIAGRTSGTIHANKLKNDLILLDEARRQFKEKVAVHYNPIKNATAIKNKYLNGTMFGKTHSEETKAKMKLKASGRNSSQFGTMWITNGQENKKIKKDVDIIPEGWYKGRVNKGS